MGVQTPRILTCPRARTTAAAEAVELAASVGLVLDPWQRLVLEKALGERADGKWAAFEVGLCVPRQNGKGSILEALELAALLVFGVELIVHSAHEFKTSKEAMRRLGFLLQESGERFKTVNSHGQEGFELPQSDRRPRGARIFFQTRTKSGGRGLSGDLVILDEAMILSADAVKALMPTLSARPNPQIWYTGSAVDQQTHVNGYVFASVRERAQRKSSPRLCFLEWSCEEGDSPTDVAARAQANPGMGYRITPEYIEDEFQAFRHDPKGFAVERLGIGDWPELSGTVVSEIPSEAWTDMGKTPPQLTGSPVLVLERSPDRKIWALVAAQHTTDGRVHVEIGYSKPCSDAEIVEKVAVVVAAWNPDALVIRAGTAAAEVQSLLVAAGIEPEMVNSAEVAQFCGGFLNAALDGRLSHSNQRELNAAVAHAVKRDLPRGGFVWELVDDASFAQLMGASVAHGALAKFGILPEEPPPNPSYDVPAQMATYSDRWTGADTDFDVMSVPL